MRAAVKTAAIAISLGLILLYGPGFGWEESMEPQEDSSTLKGKYNLIVPGPDYTIRGKLIVPELSTEDNRPPVVVMAHGLGLIQEFQLQPFINAFQNMGLAVVTFDFPTFGASSGLPRHQIVPTNNWKYIQRVVLHLQEHKQNEVDATRVALWGTSLGGGHVLDCAAMWKENSPIKAVVANVPHTQSALETVLEMLSRDPVLYLPGLVKVLMAEVKQFMMQKPWYLPLCGPPGSPAILQNEGDEEGYSKFYRDSTSLLYDGYWRNAATALSALRLLVYRPLNHASSIQTVPALFVAAQNDTLCPLHAVQKTATQIPNSQVALLENTTHFDVYYDETLKQVLSITTKFLQGHFYSPPAGERNHETSGQV